jgi:hypothetical protein
MTVKTPIAEGTLTSLVFMKLSAAWTHDHECMRGFYHTLNVSTQHLSTARYRNISILRSRQQGGWHSLHNRAIFRIRILAVLASVRFFNIKPAHPIPLSGSR